MSQTKKPFANPYQCAVAGKGVTVSGVTASLYGGPGPAPVSIANAHIFAAMAHRHVVAGSRNQGARSLEQPKGLTTVGEMTSGENTDRMTRVDPCRSTHSGS